MSCIFGIIGNAPDDFFTQLCSICNTKNTNPVEIFQETHISLGSYTFFAHQSNKIALNVAQNKLIFWADICLSNRIEILNNLDVLPSSTELSDVEIAFLAYKKWEEDFIYHISGEYVILVINELRDKIKVYTDPLGIRPFHYTFQNGVLYFSTFLHQLKELNHLSFSCNMEYIYSAVCSTMSIEDSSTAFEEILQLPRSSILTLYNGKINIDKYEYFEIEQPSLNLKNYEAYVKAFREELERVVLQRIPLDTKAVGIEYSGGLDSVGISSIAIEYCKGHNIEFYAFPYVLPEKDIEGHYDNKKMINETANHLGIKHLYYINQEIPSVKKALIDYVERFQQPYTTSLWSNLFEIEKIDKDNNAQVLFSGLGGDQCVTMNSVWYLFHLVKSFQFLKLYKQSDVISYRGMLKLIFVHHPFFSWFSKGKKYKVSKMLMPLKGHDKIIEKVEKKIKYHNYHHNSINDQMYKMITLPALRHRLLLEQTSAYDFGKEIRYPFFDAKLIQFILSVPTKYKLKDKRPRKFYKDAIHKWITLSSFFKQRKIDPVGNSNPAFILSLKRQINELDKEVREIIDNNQDYDFIDTNKYSFIKQTNMATMTIRRIFTIVKFLTINRANEKS